MSLRVAVTLYVVVSLGGCSDNFDTLPSNSTGGVSDDEFSLQTNYHIGPGDMLNIFVWRNAEISTTIPVRPDGMISTPLVEDMVAAGKTPSQLARDIENILVKYIKLPSVSVMVIGFEGTFEENIRVVGQAANPQAVPYRNGMTMLDLMIAVGGLGEFAAGNRAVLVRKVNGVNVEYRIRLNDLLNKGEIEHNVDILPGDVLIIPETFF